MPLEVRDSNVEGLLCFLVEVLVDLVLGVPVPKRLLLKALIDARSYQLQLALETEVKVLAYKRSDQVSFGLGIDSFVILMGELVEVVGGCL